MRHILLAGMRITPAGPPPRLRTALRSSGRTLRSRILSGRSWARHQVQGTSVVGGSRGVLGARLFHLVRPVAVGVVVTAVVVAIGLPGNRAASLPAFTPPLTDPFLRKVAAGDAVATAFCREVGTVQASPTRTPAQWARYIDLQVFLATDRRSPRRDPAFGAALAAARQSDAKQSAYVASCTRAGLPAG